ncbi:MAG: 4Fe-4S dicluster domain-containing protein [Calditrichaceae bacterium]|nr:4Fe-4S dicluster domain-containing protein [Calditrichia bacterium]NUQ42441.1 4Fe-4S dicluster domain-containing protein [Calditrichaceae bacterium]
MKIEDIRTPGRLTPKESELRVAFLEQVGVIPGGEKIKACIQCGTCTGSCPVSYAMDVPPRELIALFRAGDMEALLKSKAIWTCASCYACQTRCPAAIKITDVIYALKRTAMERKIYSAKFPVHSLADSFMKSMFRFGRLNEPRLMVYYFLKSGFWKAFSYLPLGLKMAGKERIEYRASKIKDIKGLRKIMKAAEKLDMPIEYEVKPYREEAVGYKAVG